jgi:hypothetical protein
VIEILLVSRRQGLGVTSLDSSHLEEMVEVFGSEIVESEVLISVVSGDDLFGDIVPPFPHCTN